jgi:hypothetical protein
MTILFISRSFLPSISRSRSCFFFRFCYLPDLDSFLWIQANERILFLTCCGSLGFLLRELLWRLDIVVR